MRHYLRTLHKRPESHRKRFSFAVSGTITIVIFAFWSMARFTAGGTLASNETSNSLSQVNEVSPLESAGMSVASSISSVKNLFKKIKDSIDTPDFNAVYDELKSDALENNGR